MEELSEKVLRQVSIKFEEYGFSVANFFIQSINFPDEDFERISKILEAKAAFEIMGDKRYTTKRSFDIYECAANNQSGIAGAFATAGIGLGAAVSMGASMKHTIENPIHREDIKICVSCGAQIPIKSKFCPECGCKNTEIICECGNKLTLEAKFCPECGKKVK